MKLKQRIRIDASAPRVWTVLSNVELLPRWLPKCKDVLIESEGEVREGFRFCIEREWKQRSELGDVVVLDCGTNTTLMWRETLQSRQGEMSVEERYDLLEKGDACELRHTLDLTKSGLPFLVRLIMKGIHTMGRPVGKTGLMHLRDLIEERRETHGRLP